MTEEDTYSPLAQNAIESKHFDGMMDGWHIRWRSPNGQSQDASNAKEDEKGEGLWYGRVG